MPAADAKVTAHFIAPDGASTLVDMSPTPNEPGVSRWIGTRRSRGLILAEVTAQGAGRGADAAAATQLGRDVLTFQRTDGVAENFHTEQNRDLLEKLSAQTGGRYWEPERAGAVAERDFLFGGGDFGEGDEGALEHAGDVYGAAGAGRRRNGCCGGSGVWYERRVGFADERVADGGIARAGVYYVTVAGLGGEPDYEQRFTTTAKDLDKLFKAAGGRACVHADWATGDEGADNGGAAGLRGRRRRRMTWW